MWSSASLSVRLSRLPFARLVSIGGQDRMDRRCAVDSSLPKGRVGPKPLFFEALDEWGAGKNPGAPRTLHGVPLVTDPSSRAERDSRPQVAPGTRRHGIVRHPSLPGQFRLGFPPLEVRVPPRNHQVATPPGYRRNLTSPLRRDSAGSLTYVKRVHTKYCARRRIGPQWLVGDAEL